jgi:hypothetical protein
MDSQSTSFYFNILVRSLHSAAMCFSDEGFRDTSMSKCPSAAEEYLSTRCRQALIKLYSIQKN